MIQRCEASNTGSPNVFLIGAPRSGTTAVSEYLRAHPDVGMSEPKEPFFWCKDFGGLRSAHGISNWDQYLSCFCHHGHAHKVVCDASTMYMASTCAVREIMMWRTSVKFLVFLRSPIEIVLSFHKHMIAYHNEDITKFMDAWNLQEERYEGRCLPKGIRDSVLVQYGRIGAIGSQLERVYEHVNRNAVSVHLLDDLKRNPRETYLSLLSFLGIQDDGRERFPVLNESRRQLPLYAKLARQPSFNRARSKVYRRLPEALTNQIRNIGRSFSSTRLRQDKISTKDLELLMEWFDPEVKKLEFLIGRDLSHWRDPKRYRHIVF